MGVSDLLCHALDVRSQHCHSFGHRFAMQTARETLEPNHSGTLLLQGRIFTIWIWARSCKRPHRFLLHHYSYPHSLERKD